MKRLLIVFILSLTLSWTNDEINWSRNLEDSMNRANASGKAIIVYFGADWCGPCRITQREVFSSPEFIEYSKKFEMVKIYDDFKRGEKDKYDYFNSIKKKYNVNSIPTFLVIKKGKTTCTINGFFKEAVILIEELNSCN
jgi:thioredoxin-related protein